MSSDIIEFPQKQASSDKIQGFENWQFKMLDALYLQAASHKVLSARSVSCDFDTGVARYAYHKSENMPPLLEFMIRKVGPKTVMFEVYKHGKGRIKKTGIFDYAYDILREEIEILIADA